MIAVFNHPRNLDHVVVNPNNPKEIKISNEEIEIQTSVVIDHDASIQSFWLFYQVDFDVDPKTSIQPCELFYHHANPQKKSMSRGICFKGPNRAKGYQISQTSYKFQNLLNT
jgi:hypothetical protein